MTSQDRCASILSQAVLALSVDVGTGDIICATHDDAVLIPRRHEFIRCSTALAHTEENVEKVIVLMYYRTFLYCMIFRRVANYILDVLLCAGPRDELRLRAEFELLYAGPVAAEGQVHGCIIGFLENIWIDEVISSVLWEANSPVVGPAAEFEGC
jgi:hypothetical protein